MTRTRSAQRERDPTRAPASVRRARPALGAASMPRSDTGHRRQFPRQQGFAGAHYARTDPRQNDMPCATIPAAARSQAALLRAPFPAPKHAANRSGLLSCSRSTQAKATRRGHHRTAPADELGRHPCRRFKWTVHSGARMIDSSRACVPLASQGSCASSSYLLLAWRHPLRSGHSARWSKVARPS